ncbi:MAG: ATP-binding protein [bacterium]|nr:GAF domain-containing protein [Myxococcales bacterium]MCB9552293.1 GAF domain-containing protein [Myxococcales bacterium]
MNVQGQSALVAALLLLGFAINVASSERRVEHRAAFMALLVAFFFYNLAWFLDSVTTDAFWTRPVLIAGVGVAQACVAFFGRITAGAIRAPVLALVHACSAAGLLLAFTEFADTVVVKTGVALFALATYAGCIFRLYRRYRTADSKVESTRLGYLVLGGVLSVVFSGADLLPVTFPSLGHLWTAVYMYFWMQVIQRSRLLDLKELLGRGLALLILSLIVSGIYIALLVWVGPDVETLGLFFFNAAAASVVLFFVFEPLKRMIDVWVGRLLYHERYVLQAEIRALRRELANVIDVAELARRVLDRLRASRRVTHGSVFFLESGGRNYTLPAPEAHIGALPQTRLHVVRDRAFLDALTRERFLAYEQVERELVDLGDAADDSPARARVEAVKKTMERIAAGVSFALMSEKRLVGVLNVRDERTREPFSTYELGLFADLGAQMAISLENSELVARLKERDRLSAIGEMATGMAHEIRNPLGAIKSAAQLLQPTDFDAESREFLDVIVEEADRLDHVLRQFLDFARPYQGELMPMQVRRVIERVAMLMRAEEHAGPVEVEVVVEEGLPAVIGDADQLHQVCLNLARNACQAMDRAGGTLTLSARTVVEEAPGRPGQTRARVEVSVSDTGPGITEDVRANLFIPFFTTKRKGTGLGLPISQRLLSHHGSEIRVETEPGRGTTMSFRLFLESEAEALTGEQRRLLGATRPSLDLRPGGM